MLSPHACRPVSRQAAAKASLWNEQEGPVVVAESKSVDEEEGERLPAGLFNSLNCACCAVSHHCAEAAVRQAAQELKEFDMLMADREEQRRLEEWRSRTKGGGR